jgi:hypothetical protein
LNQTSIESLTEQRRRSTSVASTTSTSSITRPNAPVTDYGRHTWQYYAGPALALGAVMLLAVLFVITAVIAGSVSQLTDPARAAVLASRVGRVQAYQAWLAPTAFAAIALAMLGVIVTLWGIVRRLWIRVDAIKESLPALVKPRGGSL